MFDEFKLPKGSNEGRIRKNVMKRQNLKKKWDRHCKYGAEGSEALQGATFAVDKFSEEKDNFVRLLDEGVVVEGDMTPYAVIAKGTIKKWFDSLPSNFEGYINKDHVSGIDLGKFSKAELRLVELGNDRYGVDVNVKLDHELYATKDLIRSMNRKAISSEFFYEADEYVKASAVTGDSSFPDWYLIPKISEISLVGYAVVDNPKNANSYDEDLLTKASAGEEEGKKTMSEDEKAIAEAKLATIEEPVEGAEVEAPEAPAEEGEKVEDAPEEAPVEKEEASAAPEEAPETEDATEEPDEEKSEEGEAEGEAEAPAEEEGEPEEDTADKLAAALEALKAELAALKAENDELKAKLSAKEKKEESFEAKLKNVLALASTSTPTDEEGADVTPEEKEEDASVASLRAAFKQMEG